MSRSTNKMEIMTKLDRIICPPKAKILVARSAIILRIAVAWNDITTLVK